MVFFGAQDDVYEALATEHVVARRYGPNTCVAWVHACALVLGLRERTYGGVAQAMMEQERAGVRTMVRPSGGAAVPLDAGVLNVALVLPAQPASASRLHADFVQLVDLIRSACARCGVHLEVGEIAGAVCPGTYDMHVGGHKIVGVSQHRSAVATIVHAFVNVHGDAHARALRVQQFYASVCANDAPPIQPQKMTTMAEVCGKDFSVYDVWDACTSHASVDVPSCAAWKAEVSDVAQRMRMRYDPRSRTET